MTTANEHPAWCAALERFESGYGAPFDASDPADRGPFMQLLEEEVHREVTQSLVKVFREATARLSKLDELPVREVRS